MTHKTLKEAYESVGLKMQSGDYIKSADPKYWDGGTKLMNVDGDYYQASDELGHGIYRKASMVSMGEGVLIWRNGKQIYPVKDTSESQRILTELRSRFIMEITPSLIEKLIDAKIKEAKGE